jgi:A/G-specific adenine glycosylase
MRRVIGRVVFGGDEAREQDVIEAARALVPPGEGWTWNQALIEFGALHCTARRPACVVCPLRADCAAYPVIQTTLTTKRPRAAAPTGERFADSNRYFRGRIVETLRALPAGDEAGIPLSELGPAVRAGYSEADAPWLAALVAGLQRDGLALLAEESPEYDANGASEPTEPRVRLP